MTKRTGKAIESSRRDMPDERKDEIARGHADYGQESIDHHADARGRSGPRRGAAEIARGEFARNEQVRAMGAKHGP
jgi:hypothetical protein